LEVKFDNKQQTISLLILPGAVDSLMLGWNFLLQVGTEIKCAGHEIIILARNLHNGWLGKKLSVAVIQRTREESISMKFLETELEDINTIPETSTTLRLFVGFRQINAKFVQDADPMPRINYIMNQLREAQCTALAALATWTLRMETGKSHWKKTAGNTRVSQCQEKDCSREG